MNYESVNSSIGPYKVKEKLNKYDVTYENIYNYNNCTGVIILLFIILLIIYFLIIYRKVN
jgi:hypothetical protein